MKLNRITAVLLTFALMLSIAALAEATGDSTGDLKEVRWFVECGGQRREARVTAGQSRELTVDAAPETTWNVGAHFIRTLRGNSQPYTGALEVTSSCVWKPDHALTMTGQTVRLPAAEGVYTLTGRYADGRSGRYGCTIVFRVSKDNPAFRAPLTAGGVTVQEKVAQIAGECRAQGFTNEYDIALWLHDWLIYHADYDNTLTYFDPEGVLLRGTGVCQSYSEAYCLLLDEFDIQNMMVTSETMSHAWNMARIDGIWCYIDCTWDDPNPGGMEGHTYFGMSSAILSRDHTWVQSDYPSATSLNNYYPIRMGTPCYASDSELDALLTRQTAARETSIELVYTGSDAGHSAYDAVYQWLNAHHGTSFLSYSLSGGDYSCTVTLGYGGSPQGDPQGDPGDDPQEDPQKGFLETPVDAPAFDLDSPLGHYRLKSYANNGVVLVFGNNGCYNTLAFLEDISNRLPDLYKSGVEFLTCMGNTTAPEDLQSFQKSYPNVHFTYENSSLLWKYLRAVNYASNSVTFPCVFVINSAGKITYWSTGYVDSLTSLLSAARAVSTDNAIPGPEKHFVPDPLPAASGKIGDISDGEAVVSAVQSAARSSSVCLLINYSPSRAELTMLDNYEAHYQMYSALGLSVVTSFVEVEEAVKTAHPHCTFVDFSYEDLWALLNVVGVSGEANFQTGMLVMKGGNIASFVNGELLDLDRCAHHVAQNMKYDVTLPKALKRIDPEAFSKAPIKSIDLTGCRLTTIPSDAFAGCTKLKLVRIPASVTTIEKGAFRNSKVSVVVCPLDSAAYRYAEANGMSIIVE